MRDSSSRSRPATAHGRTSPATEQTVNMILAVARASQHAQDEIPKHVDQSCLLTDDERVVFPLSAGFASARVSVHYDLDPEAFRKRAAEMNSAISLMKADLTSEHIELLVNALYWDDYRDDDFRRLHFLSLWQSFCESRRKLGYVDPDPKIKLKSDRPRLWQALSAWRRWPNTATTSPIVGPAPSTGTTSPACTGRSTN